MSIFDPVASSQAACAFEMQIAQTEKVMPLVQIVAFERFSEVLGDGATQYFNFFL